MLPELSLSTPESDGGSTRADDAATDRQTPLAATRRLDFNDDQPGLNEGTYHESVLSIWKSREPMEFDTGDGESINAMFERAKFHGETNDKRELIDPNGISCKVFATALTRNNHLFDRRYRPPQFPIPGSHNGGPSPNVA
jgi:hypothetical protein